MPKFTGVIAFPVEVLLQVLWSYFVWTVVLMLIFLTISVVMVQLTGRGDVVQMTDWPQLVSSQIGVATLFVFSTFRIFFQPRFHYAPIILTFVIAGVFGSLLLAAAWIFGFYFDALGKVVEVPAWIASNPAECARWLGWAVAAVGACGLLSVFDYFAGSTRNVTLGFGRWLGWLLVGRAAYDAFVEREAERQKKEYEDYVEQIRK